MERRDKVLRAMLELEYMVGPTTRQVADHAGLKSNSSAYRWMRLLRDDGLVAELRVTPAYARFVLTDEGRKQAGQIAEQS